jgi:hypothetical protein
MAILHGSWLLQTSSNLADQSASEPGSAPSLDSTGCFFVWGETWRRIADEIAATTDTIPAHPFAIASSELVEFLRSLQQSGQLNWALPLTTASATTTDPAASSTKVGRGRKRTATSPVASQASSIGLCPSLPRVLRLPILPQVQPR